VYSDGREPRTARPEVPSGQTRGVDRPWGLVLRRTRYIALLAAAVLIVACGDEDPTAPEDMPSPDPEPTPEAEGEQVEIELAAGVTDLDISGDLEGSLEATFEGAATVELPLDEEGSDVELVWGLEATAEELTIEGTLRAGAQETSDELAVELVIDEAVFRSEEGECAVEVTDDGQMIEGTLDCSDVPSDDETATIAITGTFEAAAAGE
jgi:hypothetical protein